MTSGAMLYVGASSPRLPEVPEQGGAKRLGDAPELDGTEDFVSVPTTPLPRLKRVFPHQLRVVFSMTLTSDDFRAEDAESNDT